jgi:serine/threonine protein kinase
MKSLLQNIGDYQILEKLGRGGMADVYLALDRKSNQRVALKLVERGEGPEAQEILEAERLGAELQRQVSLKDSRVPRIHAFGDLDGYFFIEMDFVEGSDLSVLIGSGTLKPNDAARIALELCGILRNAHDMTLQIAGREFRAIVHGDIKPRNIRIDAGGQVRVLDFGIAKGLSITRKLTSNVFGSVAYSSPERLETGRIDEMSDLWSVGIVLYEMVEMRLPFEAGSTEKLETLIESRSAIRPVSELCPEALKQIIYKALASAPGSRYGNAGEFESDLEAFLSGKTTVAVQENEETRRTIPAEADETRRTAGENLGQEAKAASTAKAPDEPLHRKLQRRVSRLKVWIFAGILFLLVIVGVWEGTVARSAVRLKPDFTAGRLDGDDAWTRYEEIRHRSPLGFASLVLRGPLQNALRESGERVCNEYRNSDTPVIREGDWIRCKRYVSHAIQLDSSDTKSAAMLNYADGHILRINRKSLDAVAAFQRAASLQPKWPDPYLGMARTYIYNLSDMERGMQALERARQLGHSFGKRELATMAEACRNRGLQAWDNAKAVRGTDQEKEFLKKALNDFNDALKAYMQIAPWGNSTTQILSVQESLAKVKQRLDVVDLPNSLLPWNWLK